MSFLAGMEIGNVFVQTTAHRGFTPEEIAERAVNRVRSVETEDRLKQVLIEYLREAQESERKTIRERLSQLGHSDIANLLGDL